MAYVQKTDRGRFRGVAKHGRTKLGTKTFDLRREALAWAERQEAAAAGGVDAKAARTRLKPALTQWLDDREGTVAPMTFTTDKELLRVISPTLMQRQISSLTPADVEKWFKDLRTKGYSDGSIKRFRSSLSTFFTWAARDGRIASNPVAASRLPEVVNPPKEMKPFSEDELNEVVADIRDSSSTLAAVVLILGWTGLRWGEVRSMRVADVQMHPTPALRVSRSHPERASEKVTKSGKARRVPLSDAALPFVLRFAEGKRAGDLLFTGVSGGQLWRQAFLRSTQWKHLGRGRRLHDLRHTAACLWLARGVDLSTVQAWLGHASVDTTNRYLHYLGTSADAVGLSRLNDGGPRISPRGPRGDRELEDELPESLVELGGIEPPTFSLRKKQVYALAA